MAAHLYWRLLRIVSFAGNYTGLSQLRFFASADGSGASLAVGGTALSSSDQMYTSLRAANAFNGNDGDLWQTDTGWQTRQPEGTWIGYKFPAPVSVNSLSIVPNRDAVDRTFCLFLVQWSDDGVAWTTDWLCTQKNWTQGPKVFPRPDTGASPQRWWMVTGVPANNAGILGAAELSFKTYPKEGPDRTYPGIQSFASSEYPGQGPHLAFDDTPGTVWAALGDPASYGYIGAVLDSPMLIEEVLWTARGDTWSQQAPTSGTVWKSAEGRSWTPYWSYVTERPWDRLVSQYLRTGSRAEPNPYPPKPSRRRRQVFLT